jgi:hypothetical protein
MANLAAEECILAQGEARLFGLESPGNAHSWSLPSWKQLCSLPGVEVIRYDACMFSPCTRRKYQKIASNIPGLAVFIGKKCTNANNICDRTGQPHDSWAPQVAHGRITTFPTAAMAEYPKEFCALYAKAISIALSQMDLDHAGSEDEYIEIFSGANAPLSAAVSKRRIRTPCATSSPATPPSVAPPSLASPPPPPSLLGEPPSAVFPAAASLVENIVVKSCARVSQHAQILRFAHQGDLKVVWPDDPDSMAGPTTQVSALGVKEPSQGLMFESSMSLSQRAAAVAGHQPKHGRLAQLIPDGIDDMKQHFCQARELSHPGYGNETICEDHFHSIRMLQARGRRAVWDRLSTLHAIEEAARDLEPQRVIAVNRMGITCRKRLPRLHVPLMEHLGSQTNIEDPGLPRCLEIGLPIVGDTPSSPFFEEKLVQAKLSLQELMVQTPQ